MAINLKEYDLIDKGVRLHKKDYTKAIFDITWRENGKQIRKRKTVKMPKRPGWSRRDYIKEAKRLFLEYLENRNTGIDENVTVNGLYEAFFATKPESQWKKIQTYVYDKHIRTAIGNKKAITINRSNIDAIIKTLRDKGAKPRTQKLILNVLRPMFEYAVQNGIIKENPTQFIKIKLPKTKKPVINATETFKRLWTTINTLYKDDPFYHALFMFLIIHGRRKGEVFGMRWENIDFENDLYTIEATKSGEDQTYTLPPLIKDTLKKLPRSRSGYVFESPVTSGPLKDIRGQVEKIRRHSGINEFTPHYARNVLVSMLAEQGVNAIFLSGALGHTDANTINKYLSMPRKKASKETAEIINSVIGKI